jgi:polygalacturonase
VDGLTIDNVKIDTNRDGIDIDCCRNVRVSNCSVNSPWDDALVLKTTLALGYPRDTQDVTITNCLVSGGYREGTLLDGTFEHIGKDYNFGHRVPRTGRIKFGTESNGGFRNIAISNCVLDNCQGLAIESVDGGVIENVGVSNITMRDIVSPPIFIRLGGRLRAPEGTAVGAIRHINISDIVGTVAASHYACIISGVPGHDIEDVRVRNVNLIFPGGGTAKLAATRPAEKEKNYPEATMFGGMPAWGFFIRHVRNIALSDVDVACLKEDARPPFFLTDVQGADFQNVRTPGYSGDAPIFALQSVQDFNARQMRGMPDTYRDWVEEGCIGAEAGKR